MARLVYHDGMICTGETYKNVVKMTFAKGAALRDPSGLFNSSLDGDTTPEPLSSVIGTAERDSEPTYGAPLLWSPERLQKHTDIETSFNEPYRGDHSDAERADFENELRIYP
jgi:hypothetical protein